jgi:hypothetical protein
MSETLTIRLPAAEKKKWQRAAASANESVSDFIRAAVRQRTQVPDVSAWESHLGSVDIAVSPPTNSNVRRALSQSRRAK